MPTMQGIRATQTGAILRLELDRPNKLNAVNTPMLRELERCLDEARHPSVRAVTITGAGRAFCSGGDLGGADTTGAGDAAIDVVTAISALPKPVVAGVHGPAAGFGCALALACDLVIAARSSYFQLAFAKVGLMPDGGSSVLIPASIGRARAARMMFLAEKLDAATAFEWGLVSHMVDDDAYPATLEAVAQDLAAGATESYGWIKRALATSTSTSSDLAAAARVEIAGQNALVRSPYFLRKVREFRSPAIHRDSR